MPYGIPDNLWNMLHPDDQAAIAASYNTSGTGGADIEDPFDIGPDLPPGTQYGDQEPLYGSYGGFPQTEQFAYDMQGFQDMTAYMWTGDPSLLTDAAYDYAGSRGIISKPTAGGGTGKGFVPSFGGGGPSTPQEAAFSAIDMQLIGAPDWWQAMAPDIYNPVSEFQTLGNLLIPFLSPEDQLTVATNLFNMAPKQFSFYNPELLDRVGIPEEITPEIRHRFFTGERAQQTLDAFDQLLNITGKSAEEFGPGYNYLRTLADTIKDFKLTSGATQLTETQQGQMLAALDPLLAQSKSGDLAAYGPIAKSFVNPFFSAGSLTGQVRNQYGDLIAPPNPRYY